MDNWRKNMIMHEKLERRLIKVNQLEIHNDVFRKLLESGTVVKLSNSEQEDWAGAVHYLPFVRDHIVFLYYI